VLSAGDAEFVQTADSQIAPLPMTAPIREPDQICYDCSRKLRLIIDHFQASLGCLLDEGWTTPWLVEMQFTPDRHLLGRCHGQFSFSAFQRWTARASRVARRLIELNCERSRRYEVTRSPFGYQGSAQVLKTENRHGTRTGEHER